MAFRAVLYEEEKLKRRRGWKTDRRRLLSCLKEAGLLALDISDREKSLREQTGCCGLALEECLLLADCEETIRLAEDKPLAVLGYQDTEGDFLTGAETVAAGFETIEITFLERVYRRFHNLPWTIAQTKRCILREITLDDLDRLYEIYENPVITQYMENLYEDRKKEEEYTKAYIQNMYRFYGYGMWAGALKETGKIIGRCGFNHLLVHGETQLELGYMVAAEYQGQGFATELCRAALSAAEKLADCSKVSCLIEKENRVSVHIAEKLGFQWKEELLLNGKPMQRYGKILLF